MLEKYWKGLSWDSWAKFLLIAFLTLQAARWPLFPQFMDIYYHLLTAWGFVQSGGYTGWDFWEYAPVGRVHIYPPVFHLILAALMKAGLNQIILAKIFEMLMPVAFLSTIWYLVRRHFNMRLGLLVLVTACASFSFYLSLINHVPATLAFIFGLLAIDQLLKGRFLSPLLLLTLCFYTHIGVSIFLALTFMFFGLFNQEYKKRVFLILVGALILSCPIIFKQIVSLKFVTIKKLLEKLISEFKPLEYVFAGYGLFLSYKKSKKYLIFPSFFLASFIFFPYPFRFFSAEGYLPIVFLAAVGWEGLFNWADTHKKRIKYITLILVLYFLLSPTVLMYMPEVKSKEASWKVYLADSSFMGMLFPERNKRLASTSLWFDREYLSAARIIKNNTDERDIIFANLFSVGTCLAGLSGRATANGMLPEVSAKEKFNPFLSSKIFIVGRGIEVDNVSYYVERYKLVKVGENKLFIFYKNPTCSVKLNIPKASVSFICIGLISLIFMASILLEKIMKKS
ncbi:hypothetical protein D4R78_05675 [bacterium]|nr:MAG: hypothetical protein D4R78_05675 [bacterium]